MSDRRKQRRADAQRLLVHYFEVVFKKAGLKWDADYTVEVEEIVDAIIDVAVTESQDYTDQAVQLAMKVFR